VGEEGRMEGWGREGKAFPSNWGSLNPAVEEVTEGREKGNGR